MKSPTLQAKLETLRRQFLTPTNRRWLRIGMRGLGAAAIAGLIWFATPFIAIGGNHPFDDATPRLIAIFLELVVIGAWLAFAAYRRRSRTEHLAAALGADSDAPVLADRMGKALSVLRARAGGRGNYLYDLPWYVLIGPPGSGKTTALINSGLEFPLLHGGRPDAIAGVGGTRYCDWWFTEDAVLIDTAGRYTTQESDAKADHASWLAFLDLLKRYRPRQPINGAIIAISLEDLLTLKPDESAAHAAAIRQRIEELNKRLGVDFPVYALFTKADLVIGFSEFFHDLDEAGRAQVWGATFATRRRTETPLDAIEPEFDALVERVNERLPVRLETEKNAAARVLLFGFPAQLAALKEQIANFLTQIFDPSTSRARAPLRGFYFTSGTQQGTPIDQLLGALAKNFSAEGLAAPVYSGRGKSFFLTDLIRQVIIGEAGFVADRTRGRIAAAATFLVLFILTPLLAGTLWVNYTQSGDMIALSTNAATGYRQHFAALTTTSDSDLVGILPALEALRNLPEGYGGQHAEREAGGLGFDQTARLHAAAEAAYRNGLEGLLRPRLIHRVEDQLAARADDPAYLHDALKVYLMLGRLKTVDRHLLLGWMEHDWEQHLYPAPQRLNDRTELEKHLVAMLDLEQAEQPLLPLDSGLIEKTQARLARVDVAQRAFTILQDEAKADLRDDWRASDAAGAGALNVFDDTLRTVTIPYFYTRAGFETAFLGRLQRVAGDAERDRWVLGRFGQEPSLAAQFDKLPDDLAALYARACAAAWRGALDKLQLRNLFANRPIYPLLHTAGLATSPLARLLESIDAQTYLVETPAARESQRVGRPAADYIAANLRPYHDLVSGTPGRRPIDAILADVNDLYQNISRSAAMSPPDAVAIRRLNGAIDKLGDDAARLPQPYQRLIETVANDARREGVK